MRIEDEIKQTKPFKNVHHKASVNLIYTGKWIIKLHSELFQPFNISIQQYNILRILHGIYPKSAMLNYIRARMLDKMSDASRIINSMLTKRLVTRVPNFIDRRKVDIAITQKGIDILTEIEKKSDVLYGFLSNLNETEIEQLNTLLDKARD